ncbi:MAG TPA: cytochrome c [Steroidobacteraceae bacterium]|nr:cytochrome c [Steroidobacteraceae bacterium]
MKPALNTKAKAVGALCAAMALAVPTFAADNAAAEGDAGRGKQLFHDHGCYGCHGFNGNTGARDLVGTKSPLIADLATFTMFLRLRADQAPLLPSSRMPNYPASALSDAQVRDIYAYVRTFKPDAPAVKDVPVLKSILESASRPKTR